MKKLFLFLSLLIVLSLACDLAVTIGSPTSPAPLPANTAVPVLETYTEVPNSVTSLPATSAPEATATVPAPDSSGVEVFYGSVRLVLPQGLASGVRGEQFSRVEGPDLPVWDMTPGHTQIDLEGYLLPGKFHQPRIYIYPALDYAQQNPGAFESMHRLNNIFYNPATATPDQLPPVPFFNAAQVFASNVQLIPFQNGKGVRFLTQYAQYPAPVNNHELFYHFQGLTSDGEYYVVAIFPVASPLLAETGDAGAALPPGGAPYPDSNDPNADWDGYYAAVSALLNNASPESFSPTIGKLDALVQSMRIEP